MMDWTDIAPVPVSHIADYYDRRWESHKCLAWQLLRRGYRQLSAGRIEGCNNLFAVQRSTAPADTARAMHAAEMRGQDMQDAPERIWFNAWDRLPRMKNDGASKEYTRTDLCITEAECQRRIQAEREACAAVVEAYERVSEYTDEVLGKFTGRRLVKPSAVSAAIRARGQK